MSEVSQIDGDAFASGSAVCAVRVTSRPFFRSVPDEQMDKWVGLVFPVRVRFSKGSKNFFLIANEDLLRVIGEADPASLKWWREEYLGGIMKMSEGSFITLDDGCCEVVPD